MSKEGSKLEINWRGIVITTVTIAVAAALYAGWLYISVIDHGQRIQDIEETVQPHADVSHSDARPGFTRVEVEEPAKRSTEGAPKPTVPTPQAPQTRPAVQAKKAVTTKPAAAQPVSLTITPAQGVLEAVNAYRATKKLSPVKLNGTLQRSAQMKANHMVTLNYWAHTSPSGVTPWYWYAKAGYTYADAGENLARCFQTPKGIVNAWIASKTHEAILRGNFTEAGFSQAFNKNDKCTYVVAHFGRR